MISFDKIKKRVRIIKIVKFSSFLLFFTIILYLIFAPNINSQKKTIDIVKSENEDNLEKLPSIFIINPVFLTMDDKNGQIDIKAKNIYQKDKEIIFDSPVGKITVKKIDYVDFSSNKASLKDEYKLKLQDSVIITYNKNEKLTSNYIDIDLESQILESKSLINIVSDKGNITSENGFLIKNIEKTIDFLGPVKTLLVRKNTKNIIINSDKLEIDDNNKIAKFIGKVSLIDEDTVMNSDIFTIDYQKGYDNLKFKAYSNIYIKKDNQTASSKEAIYDPVLEKIVLLKDVLIIRNGNQIKGEEFIYDLKNSKATVNSMKKNERVKAVINSKKKEK